MVVIDDFRKQILYQRLNLGYDCTFCKKKFYSKREQLQHLQEVHLNPRKKEHIECPKCGKVFGHIQIYQLHLQIHTLSESDSNKSSSSSENGSHQTPESLISSSKQTATVQSPQSSHTKDKQRPTAAAQKKAIGLTKIRMEDCLRCDACSCIYIDQSDYYKHMRNFHKVNTMNNVDNPVSVTIKPPLIIKTVSCKTTSSSKAAVTASITTNPPTVTTTTASPQNKCRSCCKQCRGNHIGELHNHHKHYYQHRHNRASRIIQRSNGNELFKFSMQDNIKDRWSRMVSHRLLGSEEHQQSQLQQNHIQIKPDPDAETEFEIQNSVVDSDEMTHLLSQVEVKIKTEPADER
ncbi:uncharacterized protein LOC142324049 [Lycorma delicatula]|uniref:uncharacterized protein LOC142324049 n=1 Tax=Lycorma delicatula TaxID=130591 RepID=UPI003F515296